MARNLFNRWYPGTMLFLLVVLQAGFVRCYLPVGQWLTPDPIYSDDYSYHYGDALYKSSYLSEHAMLFGYTPYTRAGTVVNAIFTVDNSGWAVFVHLLSFVMPPGTAFKLYLILTLLSIPLMLYWSGRNFAQSKGEALLCSVLGTFFLQVSVCVDFIRWGAVSYILSAYLCLVVISLFYKFVTCQGTRHIWWFVLLFSLAGWIHIFSGLHAGVPFALCYVFAARKLPLVKHALTWLAAVLTLAAVSVWLVPNLIFMPDFIQSTREVTFVPHTTTSLLEPLFTYLFFNIKFNSYMNIPFPKSGFVDLLLLGTGIVGMITWKRRGESLKSILFAGTVAFFFILAYYGSFWRFTINLTPLRFVIFMNICLAVPAATGLRTLYDLFLRNQTRSVRMASLAVIVYLGGALLCVPYDHLFVKKDFRLMTRLPAPIQELTAWIRNNTAADGRILIENSDYESNHQFYGTHLPYCFPFMTGREYLGNYANYAFSPDSCTSFAFGYLFERKISDYTFEEIRPAMDMYNITWVIVWSPESRFFFASDPRDFTLEKQIDKFYIFRVNRLGNFFIKGRGTVEATANRIVLSNLVPEDGEIIISYHWLRYLRSDPPLPVAKTPMLHDPVGFITLKNPPSRVTISLSYAAVFSDWPRIFNLCTGG